MTVSAQFKNRELWSVIVLLLFIALSARKPPRFSGIPAVTALLRWTRLRLHPTIQPGSLNRASLTTWWLDPEHWQEFVSGTGSLEVTGEPRVRSQES